MSHLSNRTHEFSAADAIAAFVANCEKGRLDPETLALIDELAGEADEVSEAPDERKYASTQFDLPPEVARKVLAMAAAIPDEDLAEDGREDCPHLTVKYGLHSDSPDDIYSAVDGFGAVHVSLGETDYFPDGESKSGDVVYISIGGASALRRLNRNITSACEHIDTHPRYQPHVTIAYVKPGLGKKYAGNKSLEGVELSFDELTFSGTEGDKTLIPLSEEVDGDGNGSDSGSSSRRYAKEELEAEGEGVLRYEWINKGQTSDGKFMWYQDDPSQPFAGTTRKQIVKPGSGHQHQEKPQRVAEGKAARSGQKRLENEEEARKNAPRDASGGYSQYDEATSPMGVANAAAKELGARLKAMNTGDVKAEDVKQFHALMMEMTAKDVRLLHDELKLGVIDTKYINSAPRGIVAQKMYDYFFGRTKKEASGEAGGKATGGEAAGEPLGEEKSAAPSGEVAPEASATATPTPTTPAATPATSATPPTAPVASPTQAANAGTSSPNGSPAAPGTPPAPSKSAAPPAPPPAAAEEAETPAEPAAPIEPTPSQAAAEVAREVARAGAIPKEKKPKPITRQQAIGRLRDALVVLRRGDDPEHALSIVNSTLMAMDYKDVKAAAEGLHKEGYHIDVPEKATHRNTAKAILERIRLGKPAEVGAPDATGEPSATVAPAAPGATGGGGAATEAAAAAASAPTVEVPPAPPATEVAPAITPQTPAAAAAAPVPAPTVATKSPAPTPAAPVPTPVAAPLVPPVPPTESPAPKVAKAPAAKTPPTPPAANTPPADPADVWAADPQSAAKHQWEDVTLGSFLPVLKQADAGHMTKLEAIAAKAKAARNQQEYDAAVEPLGQLIKEVQDAQQKPKVDQPPEKVASAVNSPAPSEPIGKSSDSSAAGTVTEAHDAAKLAIADAGGHVSKDFLRIMAMASARKGATTEEFLAKIDKPAAASAALSKYYDLIRQPSAENAAHAPGGSAPPLVKKPATVPAARTAKESTAPASTLQDKPPVLGEVDRVAPAAQPESPPSPPPSTKKLTAEQSHTIDRANALADLVSRGVTSVDLGNGNIKDIGKSMRDLMDDLKSMPSDEVKAMYDHWIGGKATDRLSMIQEMSDKVKSGGKDEDPAAKEAHPASRAAARALNENKTLSQEEKKTFKTSNDSVLSRLTPKMSQRINSHMPNGVSFHGTTADVRDALVAAMRKAGSPESHIAKAMTKQPSGVYFGGQLFLDGGMDTAGTSLGTGRYASGGSTEELYAHEYAHTIDGPRFEISRSSEWKIVFDEEFKGGQFNNYAAIKPEEAFAEIGRSIILDKTGHPSLKAAFPKAFAFWVDQGLIDDVPLPVSDQPFKAGDVFDVSGRVEIGSNGEHTDALLEKSQAAALPREDPIQDLVDAAAKPKRRGKKPAVRDGDGSPKKGNQRSRPGHADHYARLAADAMRRGDMVYHDHYLDEARKYA